MTDTLGFLFGAGAIGLHLTDQGAKSTKAWDPKDVKRFQEIKQELLRLVSQGLPNDDSPERLVREGQKILNKYRGA